MGERWGRGSGRNHETPFISMGCESSSFKKEVHPAQKVRERLRVMAPRGDVTTWALLTQYLEVDNQVYFTFPVCFGEWWTIKCTSPVQPLHSEFAGHRLRDEFCNTIFLVIAIPWLVKNVFRCPFAVFFYPT